MITDRKLFLDKPQPDRQSCFACGEDASTVEHIIPSWLQHRFNLWNQLMVLPNGTTIPYRQVTVPACARCNTTCFAPLESRIQSNSASESDIWRWANKIHYGLMWKDRLLDWDRRRPGPTIGEAFADADPFQRSRRFLECVWGDFKVHPDPFGSVFIFQFDHAEPFHFCHVPTAGSIGVCLGHLGYVVFIEDGQAVKRSIPANAVITSLPKPLCASNMMWFYAQCLEMLERHTLTFPMAMTPTSLVRTGSAVVREVRPVDKGRFRAICASLGLTWVDTEEGKASDSSS